MKERTIQCRFALALKPWRDTQGNITGVDAELWFDGMSLDEDRRVVEFDFEIPESLWKPPLVRGKIRSHMQDLFEDFIEGMETTYES